MFMFRFAAPVYCQCVRDVYDAYDVYDVYDLGTM